MKKAYLWLMTLTFIFIFLNPASAELLPVGSPAPAFKITSGDGKALALENLKGKVSVILYETKDIVEKNRPLKKALTDFSASLPDNVKPNLIAVPVINCTGAFWPFTSVWQSGLVDNSKKEGLTIYGDWDGKMDKAYGMKDNDSNIVIIDQNGVIQYFNAGVIDTKETGKVIGMLKGML
ncbi:MAG: redoxin domain-containing protein [Candidatus Saganbacteria bacterium]|nr:redoxin domain-containing protein [Candidatus Saganbacteria bacterium]